jgi:DMSO/TMAO reductase YedYZ molybdopterin-dependent catalytic subunit
VTPRGTDWTIALAVAVLGATGVLTLFAGSPGSAWVFSLHAAAGFSLLLVLWWKFRRVLRRLVDPRRWDRRTGAGAAAALLVAVALGSGIVWSSGANVAIGGFRLLAWHDALGALLAFAVAVHMLWRAKRPRRRDVAGRRELIKLAAVTAGGAAAWWLLPGGRRRFTGSYESASFEGNAFPATSWVADRPREIDAAGFRLAVRGSVRTALELTASELDAGDVLVATLDCTGGFYSTQRWRGVRLDRLVERAGPLPRARHVRLVSRTGYRWSFGLDDASRLLLATHVGDEPLSHDHGAPVRLVAPGRRGYQWVKWVERVELHDEPDYGAPASTVWSSFTAEGRGRA